MSNGISMSAPSGFTPAITEFKGVLGQVFKDPIEGDYGTRDVVFFEFGEVEVIAATSPSLDAEFTIQVNYTEDSSETRWEAIRSSLVRFMPDEADGEIDWFVGRTFHMKWMSAMLRGQNKVTKKWETTEQDCWQVEAVEGLVNRTVEDTDNELAAVIVAEIINGNTEEDALMAFHSYEPIRSMNGYAEAMSQIVNGTLLSTYEADGLITKDDDNIWHTA